MKYVEARWYTKGRLGPIEVIVAHDMEAPEGPLTAENVANYFRTTDRKASAHVSVDNNSAVRSVLDKDTAYAAPGCNHNGLHLEIAGYMRQTKAQWRDEYSEAALKQGAKVCATWAAKYDIPVRKLTVKQLQNGMKGFVGHVDVSNAFHKTDHGDPGPNFPWDYFLGLVREAMGKPAAADDWTEDTVRELPTLRKGATGEDVETLRGLLLARSHKEIGPIEGPFDDKVANAVKAVQVWGGVDDDGVVGPKTWAVLLRVHV